MTSAPFEPLRGDVPRCRSSLLLAQRERGETMPRCDQWAVRLRTSYEDLTVDGDQLLGRPRGAVGFIAKITAESVAQWADAVVPRWQHDGMTRGDWTDVVRLLTAWVVQRDAAEAAATPAAQRRFAELAADRARAARRAQLAEQQAAAAAELERLDSGGPVDPDPPRRGGWLRRSPTP